MSDGHPRFHPGILDLNPGANPGDFRRFSCFLFPRDFIYELKLTLLCLKANEGERERKLGENGHDDVEIDEKSISTHQNRALLLQQRFYLLGLFVRL